MAYLAAVLGQLEGEDTFVPVTDQQDQLKGFRAENPLRRTARADSRTGTAWNLAIAIRSS